jgi:hypothetical protein
MINLPTTGRGLIIGCVPILFTASTTDLIITDDGANTPAYLSSGGFAEMSYMTDYFDQGFASTPSGVIGVADNLNIHLEDVSATVSESALVSGYVKFRFLGTY